MIQLTLTDLQDTATFNIIASPLVASPVIAETDVVTVDNNISTYYTGTKRAYSIDLGFLDKETYAVLMGFRDRQYTDLKYPLVTISGDENINVTNLPMKITLAEQRVINNCGYVAEVKITLRESKQL